MEEESRTWLYALLIMGILSLIVFVAQHFIGRFLNIVFEVCIFYIPTIILVFIYLKIRVRRGSR